MAQDEAAMLPAASAHIGLIMRQIFQR